jgi:hypothetical protein
MAGRRRRSAMWLSWRQRALENASATAARHNAALRCNTMF